MLPQTAKETARPGKTIDLLQLVRETAESKVKVGQSFGKKQELFAKTVQEYKSKLGLDPQCRLADDVAEAIRLSVKEFWVACANRVLSEFPDNQRARFNRPICRIDDKGKVQTGWGAAVSGERKDKDSKEAKFSAVHHLEQAKRRMDYMLDNKGKYEREDFERQRKRIADLEKHLASFNRKGKKAETPAPSNGTPASNGK